MINLLTILLLITLLLFGWVSVFMLVDYIILDGKLGLMLQNRITQWITRNER